MSESLALSLSYPPSVPSAGAGRFLLLLSGVGTTAPTGRLAEVAAAGGVGADSADSFGLESFFLMTPFNSDLTFRFDGTAGAGVGFEDVTEETTGASAAVVRSSIGGSANPPCLPCNRLPRINKRALSLNARRDSLERRQLLGILHLYFALPLPLHTRRLIEELQFIRLEPSKLIRHAHLGVPFFLFRFLLRAEALWRGGKRGLGDVSGKVERTYLV